MKKFFRKHSEKITAFFLAAVFTFGFSFSVISHLAFAADLGSYSDYNASNWEEVSEDARELAQAYLDVLKSTSLGNYFDEVTDIPISWLKLASDGAWALSPISGIYYLLNSDGDLEVVHNKQGSTGTRHHLGEEPDDVVDSDTFKKVIDETDNNFLLKNKDQNLISFRNNVRDIGFVDCYGIYENRYFRVSFLDNGALNDYSFYITPFCDIDGKRYTSENTFKFYTEHETDDEGFSVQKLYVEMYLFDNGEFVLSGDPQVIASEYGVVRYVELLFGFTSTANLHFHSYNYKLYKDFMSSTARTDSTYNPDQLVVNFDPQYSSLLLYNSYPDDSINIFDHVYHYNASNCVLSGHNCTYDYCDIGFVLTSDFPAFTYSIDTTKIPDNYYITVSGDTIYDYSITNPETGQSSTVNEYITNNYTYITNNPGGEGSGSSGTTGGNVTVGGNVGVNGNVNVGGEVKFGGEVNVGVEVSPIDINVNVSGNAVSSGAGESVQDPELPDTSIFNGYLNDALDESTGIRKFISDFFGGLPGEITTLVCIGLVLAILCRLFGR